MLVVCWLLASCRMFPTDPFPSQEVNETRAERQSARMSKITNGCLTWSGTMLYSCTHTATLCVKRLSQVLVSSDLVCPYDSCFFCALLVVMLISIFSLGQ